MKRFGGENRIKSQVSPRQKSSLYIFFKAKFHFSQWLILSHHTSLKHKLNKDWFVLKRKLRIPSSFACLQTRTHTIHKI